MALTDWTEIRELERLIEEGSEAILFKHSTRCGVSSVAQEEIERFLSARDEAPVYRVLVVENRELSGRVAEALGVRHQSPQAILVRDGKPIWVATHYGITAGALEEAWSARRAEA